MDNYLTNDINHINFQHQLLSPKYTNNNKTTKIDLSSIYNIYEKKNNIIQNKLFSLIIKFRTIFKKLITDINSVLITLGNQAIYSKSLLLEIDRNDEKMMHLSDRLEMINDTKNLLDNNLLVANNNLNMFFSEVQKNFHEFNNLKNERDKNLRNFMAKNKINNLNKKNINSKSVPKGRITDNEIFLSHPSETNEKKNIKINYMTTNDKRDNDTTENYKKIPNENYFNYISPNNIYLNFNKNENLINENPRLCKSPNACLSQNSKFSKKHYFNKSQEIIQVKNPIKNKHANRCNSNISSMQIEKRINNKNTLRKTMNNIYRRNCLLSDKNLNKTNNKKKIDYNYLFNWNNNYKKINYRDIILHNEK